VVSAPQETGLEDVVRAAGTRWTSRSGFEAAKREVGLDHDAVRSRTGWYRDITLALWALALLPMLRAGASAVEALKKVCRLPRRRAPWQRSKPSAVLDPAERSRASPAGVAVGLGHATDRRAHPGLVAVAPVASDLRPV
jgi:hypothetical protein